MIDWIAFRNDIREVCQELQTGELRMQRPTASLPSPDAAWTSDSTAHTTYKFDGNCFGVIADYVDGDMVKADDLMLVVSPVVTPITIVGMAEVLGTPVVVEPQMSDVILVDGKEKVIHKIERVPASGTAVVNLIFVCS